MRLAVLLLLCCGPALRSEEVPVLVGTVTDAGTPALFEVNGRPVACQKGETNSTRRDGERIYGSTLCPQHILGETISIYGHEARKLAPIAASGVFTDQVKDTSVQGTAIIDVVLVKGQRETVVRADGYLLHLTLDTRMSYEATLAASLQSLETNQWIAYRGVLHPDGTVMVQQASIGPNVISDSEDKLRSKTEFDPAAVTERDRQTGVSRYFTGVDRTRILAVSDPPLQARVEALGARLIPAYQRALPENDPSKIHFQFQLVDEKKYAYFPLPSGIILVSREAAQRLVDDAQLAAMLAHAMADVLQKQELRVQPERHAMMASGLAGAAADAFVPGVGLVTLAVTHGVSSRLNERLLQQSARESLWLLHDAGFDVRQAPIAFWTLAEKPGASLPQTTLTPHVLYLYRLLGTAWKAKLGDPGTLMQGT